MRVAVFSDIHANCFAFDEMLADLNHQSFDRVICLGDVVQGGAQPKETLERLQGLRCPVVMGNADAWLLSEENDTVEPTSQRQRDVRAWTLSRLSPGDLDYIRSFQSTVEIGLHESQSLLCFHGSPHSYDDVLLPETREEDWLRLLGQFSPAIMAGGHTHMQQIRRIHDALFFNPGSVGVVYNHSQPKNQSHTEFHTDPCAEYSILDYDQGRISLAFRRVPYGVNELIKIIEVSGRPHTKNLINDYVRPGMERRVSPNSR